VGTANYQQEEEEKGQTRSRRREKDYQKKINRIGWGAFKGKVSSERLSKRSGNVARAGTDVQRNKQRPDTSRSSGVHERRKAGRVWRYEGIHEQGGGTVTRRQKRKSRL